MTVQETAARLTEKIARDLVLAVRATPTDRLAWRPLGNGRSVHEQLIDCCIANVRWTRILAARAWVELPDALRAEREPAETDDATALLEKTTAALVETIRSLSDEDAARELPLPWNPEVTRTLGEACFHAYWNMAYHEGQIGYVQTLYGDTDEHADSGPFGE